MNRKHLALTTGMLMMFGMACASTPFIASLGPSSKAKAERSRHDLSTLENGQFILEDFGRQDAWFDTVFIVKDWNGEIHPFLLSKQDEQFIIPGYWNRWRTEGCSDFGPDLTLDNKIAQTGLIRCRDAGKQYGEKDEWAWNYQGKAQRSWYGDLYIPEYEVSDRYLYINQ